MVESKVDGRPDLVKVQGVVKNVDREAYQRFIEARKAKQESEKKISDLQNRVSELENRLESIERLLREKL